MDKKNIDIAEPRTERSSSKSLKKLSTLQKKEIEKKTDKTKRAISSLLYILILYLSGASASAMTPFARLAKIAYNSTIENVNLTSSIFSVFSLMLGIPASYWTAKYGSRVCILISTSLQIIGCVCRVLGASGNIWYINLGMVFSGISCPFATNGIAYFSDHWYIGSNRGFATAVFTAIFPIGTLTAFLWPFIFIDEFETDQVILQKQIQDYFLSTLIPIFLLFLFSLFFFSDNNVRDHYANSKNDNKDIPFVTQAKSLFGDLTYVCMLFSCGVSSACLATLGETLNTMITPFGFEMVFGSAAVLLGFVCSMIVTGFYSVKIIPGKLELRNYQIYQFLCAFAIVIMIFSLQTHSRIGCVVAVCLYCTFTILCFPIMLEEIIHRVGSHYIALGTGMMYQISAALCAFMVYGFGVVLDSGTMISSLSCLVLILLLTFLTYFLAVVSECTQSSRFFDFYEYESIDSSRGKSMTFSQVMVGE